MSVTYRWLTPKIKARLVERIGEKGMDEEMVPICRRISALPGVATCMSCAGHPNRWERGGYIHVMVERRLENRMIRLIGSLEPGRWGMSTEFLAYWGSAFDLAHGLVTYRFERKGSFSDVRGFEDLASRMERAFGE